MTTERLDTALTRITNLERIVTAQQKEIDRLNAAREIANVVNRYTYKLQNNQFDGLLELFALGSPDVSVELMNSGVYVGAASVRKLFEDLHPNYMLPPSPGGLFVDYNVDPILEVAGDGRTARGLWYSMVYTALPGRDGALEAKWTCQKRSFDFVKQDGSWKIWHYHAYLVFDCTFYKSWVDMTPEDRAPMLSAPLPPELLADEPTTYFQPYSPAYMIDNVPPAPEPYESWT